MFSMILQNIAKLSIRLLSISLRFIDKKINKVVFCKLLSINLRFITEYFLAELKTCLSILIFYKRFRSTLSRKIFSGFSISRENWLSPLWITSTITCCTQITTAGYMKCCLYLSTTNVPFFTRTGLVFCLEMAASSGGKCNW